MRFSAICIAAITIASAAEAADQSQKLSITVYNNNLALVQDERHLDVPAGRTRFEFKDVSASIKPETVALSGAGFGVVEQNFDYDLLTPSKMMEKAVGHEIEIVRTIPGTGQQTHEKATVLSVNSGVVLRIGNRIEVLSADGLPTQVIFNSIPENLRAQPTLSVTVDAAQAGAPRRDTQLSDDRTFVEGRLRRAVRRKAERAESAGLDDADQQFGHELQGREDAARRRRHQHHRPIPEQLAAARDRPIRSGGTQASDRSLRSPTTISIRCPSASRSRKRRRSRWAFSTCKA